MPNVPHVQNQRSSHRRRSRATHDYDAYTEGLYGAQDVALQDAIDASYGEQHIQPGVLTIAKYANSIRPVAIVEALPTLPNDNYPLLSYVVLTTNNRLYKNIGNAWVLGVNGADIVADSITAGQIAAGAISASEIAVGALPVSRNLLKNGGFRNGLTNWTLVQNGDASASAALWNTSDVNWTLRDGDIDGWSPAAGPFGSTASIFSTSAVTNEPYLYSDLVSVTQGETYSAGVLMGTHRVTSAYLRVDWYSGAGVYIASSISATPTNLGLTGGPWRDGWSYVSLNGILAPALAAQARVLLVMRTPFTSGANCYLFADQAWFGVGPKAMPYEPQEVDRVRNSDGNVSIDSTGIVITNGKLTIQDEFGKSSLTASGFSGSWEDFAATGLYNGSFGDNTSSPVLGRTAAVPYWTLGNTTGTTTWTGAPGHLTMQFSAIGNAGYALSDKVRIRSGVRLAFMLVEGSPDLSYTQVSRVLRIKTYDVNGTFIENKDIDTKTYNGGAGGVEAYTSASFTPNAGTSSGGFTAVHYIAVELRVSCTDSPPARYRVLEVSITELPPLAARNPLATATLTLTTTFTDIAGCTATVEKGRSYLVVGTFYWVVSVVGAQCQGQLVVDGTPITAPWSLYSAPTATAAASTSSFWIVTTATAGSGIIKMQARKSAAAGTMTVGLDHSSLSVIPL